MKMSRVVNWGIIGPGKIANRLATAFGKNASAKLYAVASRDLGKAKGFATQYNIPNCYDNYDQLADDPNVDVIYIATPHTFHHEQALLCLKKKKAVLCEKPMSINYRLAKEMAEAARKNKTFLMEAMWTRFFPATHKMLEIISSGKIGEVKYLRADFGFQSPFDANGRVFNLKLGGGAMLDVGVYPLFLSLLVFGKPDSITSFSHLNRTGADEITNALFSYKSGSIANILSAVVSDTPKTAEFFGTLGRLTMHTPWHKAMDLTLRLNDGSEENFSLPYEGNGFEFQIAEVTNCLLNNKTESDLMPIDFSLMMAEVSDEIRRQCGIIYPEDLR
jgi:predicted dehydrogenase